MTRIGDALAALRAEEASEAGLAAVASVLDEPEVRAVIDRKDAPAAFEAAPIAYLAVPSPASDVTPEGKSMEATQNLGRFARMVGAERSTTDTPLTLPGEILRLEKLLDRLASVVNDVQFARCALYDAPSGAGLSAVAPEPGPGLLPLLAARLDRLEALIEAGANSTDALLGQLRG